MGGGCGLGRQALSSRDRHGKNLRARVGRRQSWLATSAFSASVVCSSIACSLADCHAAPCIPAALEAPLKGVLAGYGWNQLVHATILWLMPHATGAQIDDAEVKKLLQTSLKPKKKSKKKGKGGASGKAAASDDEQADGVKAANDVADDEQ